MCAKKWDFLRQSTTVGTPQALWVDNSVRPSKSVVNNYYRPLRCHRACGIWRQSPTRRGPTSFCSSDVLVSLSLSRINLAPTRRRYAISAVGLSFCVCQSVSEQDYCKNNQPISLETWYYDWDCQSEELINFWWWSARSPRIRTLGHFSTSSPLRNRGF